MFVRAKCIPEMRKNQVYELGVALEGNTLDISQTECGCPAGKGPRGSCKHIAALCYTLADFCQLGVVPEFLTCTDRLQQWNWHHAQRIDLIPVHQLGAHCRELVPPKKKSSGAQMFFDPHPLPQRSADPAALEQLHCELHVLTPESLMPFSVFSFHALQKWHTIIVITILSMEKCMCRLQILNPVMHPSS